MACEAEELVRRLYPALAAGDATTLKAILAPDFRAELPAGFPLGIGGHRDSADAMINDTWWAIGRAYSTTVEPEDWIDLGDGRLLVTGHYRGRGRESGREFDAVFMHLWAASDGRLRSLLHCTDTAAWAAAL
jgi:2-(1,2-epoxy-1,2-dihydrophenyl)acetyl-CoA isomerase